MEILKKQRDTFERLADGTKRIFNPEGYYGLEEEFLRLQKLGAKQLNKKMEKEFKKYALKEGLPYPFTENDLIKHGILLPGHKSPFAPEGQLRQDKKSLH